MAELYSHKDQLLVDHIRGVLNIAQALMAKRTLIGCTDEHFADLVSIAAAFHDFGKATIYFQDYLLSSKKKSVLSRHSLLSAVVGYQMTQLLLKNRGVSPLPDSLLVFIAIKRHHGDVLSFKDEINSFRDEIDHLIKQAKGVQYHKWNEIMQELLPYLPKELHQAIPFTEEKLIRWIQEFEKDVFKIRRWLRKNSFSLEMYFRFCNLYSLLLDADKNQAALREKVLISRKELPEDSVIQFKTKQNWFPSTMNQWREKAFQEVDQNLEEKDGKLFSIHLPTGMGKTLIALHTALKLRQKRKKELGYAPRIIYALPFLSVIDQNFDVFERVLQHAGISVDHSLLMKHHSLIEPKYDDIESEYHFGVSESHLLLEGWNSEFVCTTFVQLFQTLLSHRNRVLRRFHRLSRSIIIIDEIQAIPHKYWQLVRKLLLQLTQASDVILLTATEPKIFAPSDPLVRLCNPAPYFQAMNRVKIILHQGKKQTIEEFVSSFNLQEELTYLFILNTIESAKRLYQLLKERVDEPIQFLSTHIPPKERLKRIRKIQQGKYRIVVSTQLVEAGVDISFDVVVRDQASLEAIIQSAGRANRHGTKSGIVYLVSLWDGRRTYASYIYELVKLDVTRSLLTRYQELDEAELFELMESYFLKLKERSSQHESDLYHQAIEKFVFHGNDEEEDIYPISRFRLIEEEIEKMEVFIELDEEAKQVWEKYQQIKKIENPLERREEFLKIKKSLMDYVVSIPVQVENRPPIFEDDFLGYVSALQLSDYYDLETGYLTKGVTAIW